MLRAWGTIAEQHHAIMKCCQTFEIMLHAIRERLVGCVHADEHSIPAPVRRYRVNVEDAAERRNRRTGLVGVPGIAGNLGAVLVEMELAHAGIFALLAVSL